MLTKWTAGVLVLIPATLDNEERIQRLWWCWKIKRHILEFGDFHVLWHLDWTSVFQCPPTSLAPTLWLCKVIQIESLSIIALSPFLLFGLEKGALIYSLKLLFWTQFLYTLVRHSQCNAGGGCLGNVPPSSFSKWLNRDLKINFWAKKQTFFWQRSVCIKITLLYRKIRLLMQQEWWS